MEGILPINLTFNIFYSTQVKRVFGIEPRGISVLENQNNVGSTKFGTAGKEFRGWVDDSFSRGG
jgi:hypothetical protein